MDKKCICRKKFDTYPAQLVNCSIHPGCSCLEAQDINCIFCNKQVLEEEEEEERGEGEGEGEDSSLDLNCQEDFETAVVNPAQEVAAAATAVETEEELTNYQKPHSFNIFSTDHETLEDYLKLEQEMTREILEEEEEKKKKQKEE